MNTQHRPRIGIGCIMHETNSFNRCATRLEDFESRYLLYGNNVLKLADTNTEIAGFMDEALLHDWEVIPLIAASCAPSGPLAASDWCQLKAGLEKALREVGPIDGVLFGLHGAMMVSGEDDGDAAILDCIRTETGMSVPLVATLDLHANVSPRMVDLCSSLVSYRTYPHIDQRETGSRAAHLMSNLLGKVVFHKAWAQPALMDTAMHGRTNPDGPMNVLLAEAAEIERNESDDISCISLQIGFPWADFTHTGPSVVVSGRSRVRCDYLARYFNNRFLDLADPLDQSFLNPDQAVEEAMNLTAANQMPVVLADFADNPSGGAYGDSALLLKALVAAKAKNTVFATLCDPISVSRAVMLGEGGCGRFVLGGRYTPELTPPLDIEAEVISFSNGHFVCEGPMWTGTMQSVGSSARLLVGGKGGIDVILTSRALAVTDFNLVRLFGIEPSEKLIIALKSRNHCRAAFGPIAQKIIQVDAGGIASMRFDKLPFYQLRRPIWPLDSDSTIWKRERL